MTRLAKFGFIDARRTTNPVRPRVRPRGIPTALLGREIFYTEEPVEASRLLGRALSPNLLTLDEDDRGAFAASLHGVRLRDICLLYLDLHVAATLTVAATGSYFGVHMPMNGEAKCEVGDQMLVANTTRGLVTNPGDTVTMHLGHDSPQLIIRIEQEALVRHLTRLLGARLVRPVVFEPDMDLLAEPALRWHGAIQLLSTEVFHTGSLVQRGHGIGPLEDLITSSLLFVQPSNFLRQLQRPRQRPGSHAVREALDYIEAHLREPITMTELARQVHMSARAIQQGFRDELGTTPMAYLRNRRLERAREELLDAIPSDNVTVTDVAVRLGFSHLSHFAQLYRQRWGESPSDTLRT